MASADIGPVLVVDDDQLLCGVVTDRDIVVRAVAPSRRLESTVLGDVCTVDLVTLSPADSPSEAVRLMGEHAVRRLPVVDGRPVGIVSLADLVLHGGPELTADLPSALAGISAAPSDDPATEARPKVRAALERDRAQRFTNPT
jgi:signal-transduction protein with cAMP-binding, CBS, and nucleotidyltransferase domain